MVERVTERVVNVIAVLGGVLMVVLTLVVFLSVVSRYFFDLPIRSTSEMAGLIFAWLVFLTTIAVTYHEDNIAITYFRKLLPTAVQRVVEIVTKLIVLGFVLVVLISSIRLSMAVIDQPLPSLRISSAWLNGAVAVPFMVLALVSLLQVIFAITRRATSRVEEQGDLDSPAADTSRVKGIE